MKRREFIAGLGGAAVWPEVARAQQPTKPTIGVLTGRLGGLEAVFVEGFRRGLAEVGFLVGRDVTVEYYLADGHPERLPALATGLVRRRPAAIVAREGFSALAAKAATRDIPIIFGTGSDPVESGLVTSLNRPGGNLTGITTFSGEVAEKRLELLHKAMPTAETIALLAGPGDVPLDQAETPSIQSAARTLGLRLLVFNLTTDTEIAPVFATLVEHQAGAIVVGGSVIVNAKREQILSLAARFRLPTMFVGSRGVRAGALLSYGPDPSETPRQMGAYTGRILKGEKPADLPIIRVTKFEFVINLQTAKALGLNLPPTLLAIADEVIE
jgi:putative tryptophan/tyrosine transport system substrate-binding protein